HRVGRRRARELEGIELKTRQDWQRKLLYDVVLLLANTGMRVDELKTLVWRNIDWKDGSILLEHAGKTKSTRRVLMRKSAIGALARIRERRLAFLSRSDKALDLGERVIALPNGRAVGSLKKGFDQLLVACGFRYASVSEKHALTSLRHTYATL